jgi:hypothetical protein
VPYQFTGFQFAFRISKATPTVQKVISADAALAKGDLVNLESGKADLAVTNDTALMGAVLVSQTGMDTTSDEIEVITDDDAVYAVYDANARVKGEKLDITGTTGAQSVGAPTNNDLIVYADSGADELTYVMISQANHWLGAS